MSLETFKRLKRFYWPFKGYFFVSLSALFLVTGLTMIYPLALKITIDEVIGAGRYEWVPWIVLGFVLLMLFKSLAAFVQQFTGDLFGIRTVYELRNALYRKLESLPLRFYEKAQTPGVR